MRVLVISDTHLSSSVDLPTPVLELANLADHVLHAGDVSERDVLTALASLAPVSAVRGNVESSEIAAELEERVEIELCGVRIGMIHNAGARAGRIDRMRAAFNGCDVVVYGHSHEPEVTWSPDRSFLLVNPGSPTQKRRAPTHTVVWLEVGDGLVESAELIHLD